MTTAHPLLEPSVPDKRDVKIGFVGAIQSWNQQ
ncbi:hypothetical protein ABIB82_002943 [Bradyrhizobium sp. i1.8.4]